FYPATTGQPLRLCGDIDIFQRRLPVLRPVPGSALDASLAAGQSPGDLPAIGHGRTDGGHLVAAFDELAVYQLGGGEKDAVWLRRIALGRAGLYGQLYL